MQDLRHRAKLKMAAQSLPEVKMNTVENPRLQKFFRDNKLTFDQQDEMLTNLVSQSPEINQLASAIPDSVITPAMEKGDFSSEQAQATLGQIEEKVSGARYNLSERLQNFGERLGNLLIGSSADHYTPPVPGPAPTPHQGFAQLSE